MEDAGNRHWGEIRTNHATTRATHTHSIRYPPRPSSSSQYDKKDSSPPTLNVVGLMFKNLLNSNLSDLDLLDPIHIRLPRCPRREARRLMTTTRHRRRPRRVEDQVRGPSPPSSRYQVPARPVGRRAASPPTAGTQATSVPPVATAVSPAGPSSRADLDLEGPVHARTAIRNHR